MVKVTYDILNGGICASTECNNSDDEGQDASQAHQHVLLGKPLALAKQDEPHDTGNPERETRNEESRGQREQVRENGDSLSDDPSDDSEDGHKGDPADPTHGGVDISQN